MIQELTKENLQKLYYTEDEINRMLNAKEDCSLNTIPSKNVFISKTENKFYTGIDYWRAWHFKRGTTIFPSRYPEFFEEYFNITLNEFLEKQKAQLSIHFEVKTQFEKFLLIEIKKSEEIIKGIKDGYKSFSHRPLFGKGDKGERDIYAFEIYIQFLDNKLFLHEKTNTTNPEAVKPNDGKKKLHNDIFKDNAFEIFEFYKEKKKINVNSRTDLRVIFDLLKSDNLLLETIELKHYINWLNRVYYNGDITELKKQNLNSKPNIIRTNDYNDYKKSTLKQP
jgi:hypothetical protein